MFRAILITILIGLSLFLYSDRQDSRIMADYYKEQYNKTEIELDNILDNLEECTKTLKELNEAGK